MSLPRVPDPEVTKTKLSWLLPDVYRAFEHGVFKAKTYFDAEGLVHEPFAFATLVRLHARGYLKEKGHKKLVLDNVMLCGLSLRTSEDVIKIWKSDDSTLPAPGDSEPKQEFYQQSFGFPDDAADNGTLRLAVLWNLDSLRNLTALWLVCPKWADEKNVEAWWCTRIDDPASAVVSPQEAQAPPDLDIRRKAPVEKKAGNA